MSSAAIAVVQNSKGKLVTGWVMSGLVVLFMTFDGVVKLMKLDVAIKGTAELGYSPSIVFPLGVVLLICTVLYTIPRTAVLGAILLTGYLGGAVATQVRVGNPWLGFILAPVYVGIFVWGGLYCRDARIRALIPLRSRS